QVALGDGDSGIKVSGEDGFGNQITENVISGNAGDGITLDGASETLVTGNWIGTTADGTGKLANGGSGVALINGANSNTIGSTSDPESFALPAHSLPLTGNLISGNGFAGLWVRDSSTSENLIAGNYIGTNLAGTGAVPNATWGILVHDSPDNTIGGTQAGDGN